MGDSAAILGVVLLALVGAFQIALALGAPWGAAAWGGAHPGVLPPRLRVSSLIAGVVIYPVLLLFVLASAGLAYLPWMPATGRVGMWVLSGVFAVDAVANFASRSKVERLWGPVSLAIALCSAIVAAQL